MACERVLGDRSLIGGEPVLSAHFDLPATLRAPGQARGLVADALSDPAAPPGCVEVIYTAQLLVSELVTNAVTHARTELHLGLCADARTLLFAISDGHPDLLPDARPPTTGVDEETVLDYEESGRGIAIIVELASDFGWRQRANGAGKVMWFTLAVPVPVPVADR